jgi:5-methylcytosine-specific restriction endonuclease McrA
MSNILTKCHDFNFSETYAYADLVRKAIFDNEYGCEPVEVASDFEEQSLKPKKHTLLHDFIEHCISEDIRFNFYGPAWDVDCVEPVLNMLCNHYIRYKTLNEYVADMYRDDDTGVVPEITEDMLAEYKIEYSADYIQEVANEHLLPLLGVEVFNILFNDREAMKQFNMRVAEYIGVKTKRCTYWPKWLERALFCREKGLCAICKSDLSSIFHTHGKLAIDHIVPVAKFGVNDPTNLQILCENCNGKKSDKEIVTSNSLPVFW